MSISAPIRKTCFVIFLLWQFSLLSFAQKEANTWYFGYFAGLEFSSGNPIVLTDGAITAFEGCASYSNADGELLFYTNGGGSLPIIPQGEQTGYIWNRNHEVMYDMGQAEGGGFSSAQNSIVLPKIGSDHEYYLFTMDQSTNFFSNPQDNRGLSYFLIDMEANNGLGEVTLANEPVYQPAAEALTAILHKNGTDYWLLTVDSAWLDFVVVPVDENGIQTVIEQPRFSDNVATGIKASPNGEFIFCDKEVYRFNRANGQITFWTELPETSSYSFSFSPNSRYLYALNGDFGNIIHRYDLMALDLLASQELVAVPETFFPGQMQIAPDGNIYYLEQTFDLAVERKVGLSVIRCPDSAAPMFEQNIFVFETDPMIDIFVGLPNYADFIFETLNETEESFAEISFCEGDTILLDANFNGDSYLWSTGDTTASILVFEENLYVVTVSDACGREIAIRNFELNYQASDPVVNDLISLEICEGESIDLSAEPGGSGYQWSNGEVGQSISVVGPGEYEVSANFNCAFIIQPFELILLELPEVHIDFDKSLVLCLGDSLQLSAELPDSSAYLWSTGAVSPNITAAAGENYAVTVSNECGETTAAIEIPAGNCCMVDFPNAFSPNGDTVNDFFLPLQGHCEFSEFQLSIYNRWGALVFETADARNGWDGRFKNKMADANVYVWKAFYRVGEEEEELTGDLLLLR